MVNNMDHYVTVLVTTIHSGHGGLDYLLETAVKFPFELMEAEGVYSIEDINAIPWLYNKLPLHARGKSVVRVERICDAVIINNEVK